MMAVPIFTMPIFLNQKKKRPHSIYQNNFEAEIFAIPLLASKKTKQNIEVCGKPPGLPLRVER